MTTTMPGQPWGGAARSAAAWPAAATGGGSARPGCKAARTAMAATAADHHARCSPWSLEDGVERGGSGVACSSTDPHPAEVASAASAFSACRHQHQQTQHQASHQHQHQQHQPTLAATTCSAFSRVPGRKRPRPPSASPSPAGHHQCPSPASSTGGTTTASDAEGEAPARHHAAHHHGTERKRMQVWRPGPTPPGKEEQQLSPLTDSSGQSTPPSLLGEEEGGRSPTPMGGGHAPPAPEGRAVSSSGGETDGEGMEVDYPLAQPPQQPQAHEPGGHEEQEGEAHEQDQAEDDWDAAARWLGAIGVVELPAEAGPRSAAAAEGGATDADGRVDEEAVCAGWAWAEACGAPSTGEGGQGSIDWEADPAFRPWSSQSVAAARPAEVVKGVGVLGLASAGTDGGSAFTRLAPRPTVVIATAAGGGGAAPAPVAEWDWPHRQHPLQRTVDSDASGASAVSMDLGHREQPEDGAQQEEEEEEEEEERRELQRQRLAHSGSPVPLPPAAAILDEAAVQVDPKVRHVCLARRTLEDREMRVLFGPKGFPEFLGMGPLAVVPTYQALMQEQGRPFPLPK